MTFETVIQLLKLEPHPAEGGFFKETYTSEDILEQDHLPRIYRSSRKASTAIYFLITDSSFSAMHKLKSDEIFHFYLGDPVEMFLLESSGKGQTIILGQDIAAGQTLQQVVPRDYWQGLRVKAGGKWSLLGTTVAPGFEYEDFELGERDRLVREYPDYRDILTALTRNY